MANDAIEKLNDNPSFRDMLCAQKWKILLKKTKLVQLRQIVDTVFAIPVSNAECKRIFSRIKLIWTDIRNRLNFETVAKLIELYVNSNKMSCKDMYQFLIKIEDIAQKIVLPLICLNISQFALYYIYN